MGYVSRLLEWRAHPSSDMDWGRIFDVGMQTAAGVNLSVEGSLTLPAVYACVRVLAESIASLPLLTYERSGRSKTRASSYPVYGLLKQAPNPEQTSFEWRELKISHAVTWGNGYSEIAWSNGGQVQALWPLRPDRMEKVERKNGELLYHYRRNNGQLDVLPAYRVHHLKGLGGDGLVGYSPVRLAMQAIGLGLATEEFGSRFFSNGARPGIVIKHPGVLKKEAHERLKASWNSDHQGVSNAHKVKILEEGAGIEKIGVPPEEAQFLETRRFQALEIARIYRVPPHKIGLLENATFSNIEHQAIEFVVDTIRPWLVRHEQALRRDVLVGRQQDYLLIEYLVDGLLRGDTLSRYQAYAIARQWGWLSANDIREMENMDPIAGGDAYLTPLNMVAAGEPAKTKRWSAMLGLRQVYEDAARRLVRREAADLRRGLNKYLKRESLDAFEAWADVFYRELLPTLREMLLPAVRLHCDLLASDRRAVEEQFTTWAGAYVLAARQALSSALHDSDQGDLETDFCRRIEAGHVSVASQLMEEIEQYAIGT